jgi:hypothetical protein
MMFVGARQVQASQIEAEDLGQYQQLIELQKQIVAVAEQNAATQRAVRFTKGFVKWRPAFSADCSVVRTRRRKTSARSLETI